MGHRQRTLVGLLVALAMLAFLWWTQGDEAAQNPASQHSQSQDARPTSGSPGPGPDTGLPTVSTDQLPPEAADTLDLIEAGGPFPYDRDGVTFENREQLLPDHPEGYYREYTVQTPGSEDRGARRIVAGYGGELYWTDDHYASFSRIER